MRYAKYIGRVGALAVALGIGAAVVAMPWVASAAPNVSVSANGETRVEKGTATSSADGKGSVAIAHGANSYAEASGGDHNKALVNGDNSRAFAQFGNNNTATVKGDGGTAVAGFGDNNTTTVDGFASNAFAGGGD